MLASVLIASLAVGALTACSTAPAKEKEAPIALASHPRVMKLPVVGMGCRGCAKEIGALLRHQPGVMDAEVSFEHAEAYVVAGETNGATREQIARVIDGEMKRRAAECAAEGKSPAK
ncbi:MAG: heavy-metal-associated domain-containing protein [Phycisphaerales bacterium]|jgi:copper chaperone CopZ|nr:heavy-metal-associated domain-containing protein [Phycisphaerales bacterium]